MKRSLFLILIPLLLVGCNNTHSKQLKERLIGGSTEERVIPVGILCIDPTEGIVCNTYPGYLEEGQSADLAFKYGGLLEHLYVKEGSHVNKGQRLAQVASPTLENSLRSAQATLEQAQDAYDRLKKVHDNGSLPDIKWKEMEANLEKAQAAYDLAQGMINENNLIAPFSGTISAINAELGENIPPLKPVISLINTEKLAVKVTVPEAEIAAIHVGDPAEIVIPALNDRSYHGKVSEKGLSASLLTHSYPVKLLIDHPDKDLVPGMISKVMLKADVNTAIIVPANAILINKDGNFVWVEEDGRATRRMIQISGYSGNGVIVNEGLQSGDRVIVEGYQKVSEGMKVDGSKQRK
jgi:RND family efflux transporter MFP subunit